MISVVISVESFPIYFTMYTAAAFAPGPAPREYAAPPVCSSALVVGAVAPTCDTVSRQRRRLGVGVDRVHPRHLARRLRLPRAVRAAARSGRRRRAETGGLVS